MRLVLIIIALIISVCFQISCSSEARSVLSNSDDSPMLNFKDAENTPASAFLRSLTATQRQKAIMPINDSSREKWHYLPSTYFNREGIELSVLTKEQNDLAFELIKSYLSKTGYDKTRRIIELENILAEIENNPRTRDPEKYYIAFYGNPVKDKLWAWSFEGHHISLNFTITDNNISIAPRFFGANPATIQTGKRKGERTLADEEDLGLELVNSLNAEQKQKAIFQQTAFSDIVTANQTKVSPLESVGIKLKELDKSQTELLIKLINVYLAAMPEKLATARARKLEQEEFDEIRFGWAGLNEINKPHYYRIQGKTFLIEFDNTQNNANHIHTVWRDFDGDFGRNMLQDHYQNSDHHK